MTVYEAAMNWVVQGFSVIPIRYMDKRPDSHLLPKNHLGDPTWEIFREQLPSTDQLKKWFPSRLHNLGVVMGWNNLVVIDFDIWDVFLFWYKRYAVDTYMVKTSRGVHVYLQVESPVKNYHSDSLDIKAIGYVLAPPSVHPSGFEYQVFLNKTILSVNNLRDVLPPEFTPDESSEDTELHNAQPDLPMIDDPWQSAELMLDIDAVSAIRERVDILSFFPNAEKKSRDGRWWTTLCPFHADKHPSFWVDTSRKICGCYTCNMKPLDVINLYARLHGLTNRDAIWALSKML